MTDFDMKKAVEEQIIGMAEIVKTMTLRENAAQQKMVEAENEVNAFAKLRGYAQIELTRLRNIKAQLEQT